MHAGDIVPLRFDPLLVGLSFLLAFTGSYVALAAATRIRKPNGGIDFLAIASAALGLGGVGVWSMHFLGMMAQQMPFHVAYELDGTLASFAAAVGISALAFWYVGRARGRAHLLAGGAVLGMGFASMHYIGMFAERTQVAFQWNSACVVLSVLIAVVAGSAALWLAFSARAPLGNVGAAALMAAAICGMHYTGMLAATDICTAGFPPTGDFALEGDDLPYLVFALAMVVMLLVGLQLFVTRIEDQQTDTDIHLR